MPGVNGHPGGWSGVDRGFDNSNLSHWSLILGPAGDVKDLNTKPKDLKAGKPEVNPTTLNLKTGSRKP